MVSSMLLYSDESKLIFLEVERFENFEF